MEVLKNGTISLPAYLEDSNNDPVTGKTLAEVLFDIDYTDGTAPSSGNAATRELGDGWYAYDYTDANAKDFIYIVRDSLGVLKNFPGGHVEIINITDTTATHTHADDTTEQTVFEETISSGMKRLSSIRLDLYNLTKSMTIRLYEKIDGTNYRVIDYLSWNTAMADGVAVAEFLATKDIKLTLQSGVLEGASRNIPYRYKLETL